MGDYFDGMSDAGIEALAKVILAPLKKAQDAGFVACEKCKPGCGQTWSRCPACNTLHSDI